MDFKQLTTFKKVVETGNITSAANELSYAQPTVTLHIQTLEHDLGVSLFERIGKKLVLTDAGRELYKYTQSITQIMGRIKMIGSNAGSTRSMIRLAVPPAIVKYLMCDILDDFIRNTPQTDFQIINDHNPQKIYKYLLDGTVDFAILPGRWYNNEDVRVESLGECRQLLIADRCLDFSKLNLTVSGLGMGARMIYNHYLSSSRQDFENYLNMMDIQPDAFLEVWSIEVIKHCVARGVGLTFVPEFVVSEELHSGQFVEVPVNTQFENYRINLVYRKSQWEAPMFKSFRENILSKFNNCIPLSAKTDS